MTCDDERQGNQTVTSNNLPPLPRVIDYPVVLETLTAAGFESLYHNSGAFGFPREVSTHSVGWIAAPDPALRPEALPMTRLVPPPAPATMAMLAERVWRDRLPGPAWVMPKSHWAYELDFGNADWLPALLRQVQVDPDALAGRNDGAAIEFAGGDGELLVTAVEAMLTMLNGSDFAIAWPRHPVACTIHHHGQLWWTTSDRAIADALDTLMRPGP